MCVCVYVCVCVCVCVFVIYRLSFISENKHECESNAYPVYTFLILTDTQADKLNA